MNPTPYVLLVNVVLLILYDIIAVWYFGAEAALSNVVQRVGYKYPIIVFAIGMLVGHWFWPVK